MVFFRCKHCGNIIVKLTDSKVPVVCCGEPMQELKANVTDAATEKHVPVVEINGNKVNAVIGSVIHPMTAEHHIEWIYLETNLGGQFKFLSIEPKAEFVLADGEKAIAVYEHCNLHGLWKKEL